VHLTPRWFQHLHFTLAALLGFALATPAPAQTTGRGASIGGDLTVYAAERAYSWRNYNVAWELALGAIQGDPPSLPAIRVFVDIASDLHRQSEVLRRFDPETAATPEEKALAHYARSYLALQTGDLVRSREEIGRAMGQVGRNLPFEIRRLDLVISREEGKKSGNEIFREYEQLVAENNDNGLAHLSYINTFHFYQNESRRHKRAVAAAMAAPERTPQTYLRQINLEENSFWFDPARALEIANQGLAEFPDAPELALGKVTYLRRLGRTGEALDLAREWVAKAPNHGGFRTSLVDVLEDLGRYEEAIAESLRTADLTHQPEIIEAQRFKRARLFHYSGKRPEAIEALTDFVRVNPTGNFSRAARMLLFSLQTSQPTDVVRVIADGGYVQQRGNYCGPATLSMVLGHWGVRRGQEDVAASVYTGIAGTPPQVIHHYIASVGLESVEFKGTDESWKRLIDAGIPVLWLQMNGSQGGHYRVVLGYDDVLKNWIVSDPNFYARTEMSYELVDDTWILPSLRRSIAIVPKSRIDDPALADLAPTPILFITNWVLYVATGANLFVGLFPALLVNLLVALVLAWAVAGLLRRITYPNVALSQIRLMACLMVPIAALNLVVGIFRLSQGVSVLLALHLALVTLIPLLALLLVFRRLIHDILHPRESLGLVGLVIVVWLCLAFIDQDPWQWVVPVCLLVAALPAMLWPRLAIKRAESALRNGELNRALELARRHGHEGARYFAAIAIEIDGHLSAGSFDRVVTIARKLLAENAGLGRPQRLAIRLYQIGAEALRFADEDIHAEIVEYLKERAMPRGLRTVADGLLLYVDGEVAARGGSVARIPNNTEVDTLLAALSLLGRKALPGFPVTRTLRGRSLQSCAFLLALTGALRLADAAENPERRQHLWMTWSGRYGLMLRLVRGFEVNARPSRAVVRKPAPNRSPSEERRGSGVG